MNEYAVPDVYGLAIARFCRSVFATSTTGLNDAISAIQIALGAVPMTAVAAMAAAVVWTGARIAASEPVSVRLARSNRAGRLEPVLVIVPPARSQPTTRAQLTVGVILPEFALVLFPVALVAWSPGAMANGPWNSALTLRRVVAPAGVSTRTLFAPDVPMMAQRMDSCRSITALYCWSTCV